MLAVPICGLVYIVDGNSDVIEDVILIFVRMLILLSGLTITRM